MAPKNRETSFFTLLKGEFNPAFSYLVFVSQTEERENTDFDEVLDVLNGLGIKALDRKFYLDEAMGQAYLKVKLKVKKLEIGEHEQLGSLLPKDVTYYFYSRKKED